MRLRPLHLRNRAFPNADPAVEQEAMPPEGPDQLPAEVLKLNPPRLPFCAKKVHTMHRHLPPWHHDPLHLRDQDFKVLREL